MDDSSAQAMVIQGWLAVSWQDFSRPRRIAPDVLARVMRGD
ncbi:MAG: hypothetical protein NZ899_12210 [Thermoguttaceae bacterium]|nr:hypothetical protein [Thermoguttaceae bacterium]MDW8079595.1 hypothetical protein [Thermoguttaceae bacterium]